MPYTGNSDVFSGKQFQVGIGVEEDVGTAVNATILLDADSVTFPAFNPVQEFELRSGASRVADFSQIFSSTKRVTTEFSVSGRLTTTDYKALFENVLGQDVSTDHINITNAYAPATIADGEDATGGTGFAKTMTISINSPHNAGGWQLLGCVCTSLELSADMNSAAGRFNYSATFGTQYAPQQANVNTVVSALSAGTTKIFLPDLIGIDLDITAGGTATENIVPLFNTFGLTIDNPIAYLGTQVTGTIEGPQVIGRAVPELSITFNGNVKYDSNTDKLFGSYSGPSADFIAFQMVNNASVGDATFGWTFPKAKLSSCELDTGDIAGVSFEAKAFSTSSTNLAEFDMGL